MVPLRRNSLWLSLLLVLAMVTTIGGTPALAIPCAPPSHVAAETPIASAPSQGCHEKTADGACCCGPSARTAVSPTDHSGQLLAVALGQPGCGCAIEAPIAPPASSLKSAVVLLSQDLAFLPGSPLVLHLPTQAAWAYAVSANGPPKSPVRASGPSRAPPAC